MSFTQIRGPAKQSQERLGESPERTVGDFQSISKSTRYLINNL